MADKDFFDGSLTDTFKEKTAATFIAFGLIASPAIAEEKSNIDVSVPLEKPTTSFFFHKGEEKLTETSEKDLKIFANYVKETKGTFEINGCASPEGNANYNAALTERRAHTIANILQTHDVKIDESINRTGQNRDIIGLDECPPLHEGQKDTPAEAQRADIILNPVYLPAPKVVYPDTSHLPWGGWGAAFDKLFNGTPIPQAPETLETKEPQAVTVKP